MAAPKHATFIYSTFCQTRAQIIYDSPQNEWAVPAPEYPTIATPLPYPPSLYIAYIPRHICRIVCVHGLEYGHSTCLAPGLRPGHSLTLPLPLPPFLLPLCCLLKPRAICALWTWWNMILLFKLTVYPPFVSYSTFPAWAVLRFASAFQTKKEGRGHSLSLSLALFIPL